DPEDYAARTVRRLRAADRDRGGMTDDSAQRELRSGRVGCRGISVMMRIRLPEEPLSRLALWSRRVAVFSIAVVLLSIIIVRYGLLELVSALATFGAHWLSRCSRSCSRSARSS